MPTVGTRPGRPPKHDEAGTATRERLLAAAVAACVEHGFDGATVADIARRADVSAPAIYNHFGGKVALMVAAAQAALGRLAPPTGRLSATEVVEAWLADSFAPTRRLLTELHVASHRHPELAGLLAAWHVEQARAWSAAATTADPQATVATFFALLLGLCHLDALGAVTPTVDRVVARAQALGAALYPEENPR